MLHLVPVSLAKITCVIVKKKTTTGTMLILGWFLICALVFYLAASYGARVAMMKTRTGMVTNFLYSFIGDIGLGIGLKKLKCLRPFDVSWPARATGVG